VRLPNVFADTSGVRYFDVLADAVRRAGADKVLFGSDGPFLHPGVEIAKIHALHLSPPDAALVLGGNILRLTRVARQRRHP
jgi:predicted TIM-barrel fold metal-dependent hydrolase